MSDSEVKRLRKLRTNALRVRAMARALEKSSRALHEPWLAQVGDASWRVARAVSGHLKSHPYHAFQRGVGPGTLLWHAVRAKAMAHRLDGPRARLQVAAELQGLSRILVDARALTYSPALSESFGRSHLEIGGLLLLVPELAQPGIADRSHRVVEASTPQGDWLYLNL